LKVQGSALPPARKMAGQFEKETNNSPQSSQRALSKKLTSAFSAFSAVRYFLKMASDFMKFHTRGSRFRGSEV
jgi:hypothetical protein